MKKFIITMVVALMGVVQANALSNRAIRENARFLSDRMAYELGLDAQQYSDCYEINYDFIASINPLMDDVCYGYQDALDRYYNYLDYRNEDLRYIMTERQYRSFMALDYFFRPIYTTAGNWLFRVFQIYNNPGYFYFDAPGIFWSYVGGHGRHYYANGFYGGGRYHHQIYGGARPFYGRQHRDEGYMRRDYGGARGGDRGGMNPGMGRGNGGMNQGRGGNDMGRRGMGPGNGSMNQGHGNGKGQGGNQGGMGQGGQNGQGQSGQSRSDNRGGMDRGGNQGRSNMGGSNMGSGSTHGNMSNGNSGSSRGGAQGGGTHPGGTRRH